MTVVKLPLNSPAKYVSHLLVIFFCAFMLSVVGFQSSAGATTDVNDHGAPSAPAGGGNGDENGNDGAADNTPDTNDPVVVDAHCSNNRCDIIAKYVTPVIKLLSGLVGLIVVISLIIGAMQYAASEGDAQKASRAKKRIANTIFALAMYIFMFAFLQFIVPGGVFR